MKRTDVRVSGKEAWRSRAGHPLARHSQILLGDLRDERLLARSYGPDRTALEAACIEEGFVLSPVDESSQLVSIAAMVEREPPKPRSERCRHAPGPSHCPPGRRGGGQLSRARA